MRTPAWDDRSVLGKTFRILDAFGPDDVMLTQSEIVKRTGYPKATVHRHVTHLVSWGAIDKVGSSLRLGTHLFELGLMVPQLRTLRETANPISNRLHGTIGTTVTLAVLEGSEVLCLDRMQRTAGASGTLRVGGRSPAQTSALGKVMLAYSQPERIEVALSQIAESNSLREELDQIRDAGVAYTRHGPTAQLICAAAPIFTPCGEMAALSVSVAGTGGLPSLVAGLRAAAQQTTKLLRRSR